MPEQRSGASRASPAERAPVARARPGVGEPPASCAPAASARRSLGQLDAPAQALRARGAGSVFDVCHVGVVLRAVVLVQAVVALGVALCRRLAGAMAAAVLHQRRRRADRHAAVAGDRVRAASAGWRAAELRAMALRRCARRVRALASAGRCLRFAGAAEMARRARCCAPAAGRRRARRGHRILARAAQRSALPADTTARLAELQSRIRPHFLFNTLNTAMALVRVDPRRAEGLLADLAELFRVALAPGGRFGGAGRRDRSRSALPRDRAGALRRAAAVHWELDDAAAAARVPPLLLQPLLENAVRHGIEPSPAGGTIRVRTRASASMR